MLYTDEEHILNMEQNLFIILSRIFVHQYFTRNRGGIFYRLHNILIGLYIKNDLFVMKRKQFTSHIST